MIYIAEAHPGSIVTVPNEQGGKELRIVPQPNSESERLANLRNFLKLTRLTIPSAIDDAQNTTKRAYASWPDRMYVIGADGKVAFKGDPGPRGFRVPDLEAWLRQNVK